MTADDEISEDQVEKFAKIRWNLNPNSFVTWETLKFQAGNDEGDATSQLEHALQQARQLIREEREIQKAETEKLAKKTQEVWKFTIDLTRGREPQDLHMPKGAKILTVKDHITFDNRLNVQIWALVDPDVEERIPRQISIFGSGHPIPLNAVYLGTVFFGHAVVYHVWETFKP